MLPATITRDFVPDIESGKYTTTPSLSLSHIGCLVTVNSKSKYDFAPAESRLFLSNVELYHSLEDRET